MSETRVGESDPLPRPGPIGRSVRLLLGLALLYLVVGVAADLPALADGANLANPMAWIALAYVLYALPDVTGVAISAPWSKRQVRLGAGGLLILASAADLALVGSPNGGVFGLTFGLLLALVLGVIGVSFVVAAAAAAPG